MCGVDSDPIVGLCMIRKAFVEFTAGVHLINLDMHFNCVARHIVCSAHMPRFWNSWKPKKQAAVKQKVGQKETKKDKKKPKGKGKKRKIVESESEKRPKTCR